MWLFGVDNRDTNDCDGTRMSDDVTFCLGGVACPLLVTGTN